MRDLRHPIQGHRLAPIGYRKNGAPIWPIMGGSQNAGDDASGGGSNSDGANGGQGATGGNNDTGSQSGATGGDAGKKDDDDNGSQSGSGDTVARAEYEALKTRNSAADRRAAAAEAELQKIKDKDKSELEIAQRDKKTAEESVAGLQSEINNLRMKVAFLSDAQVQWHDPADALLFLTNKPEDYGLSIEDDGTVKGMKEAVKRLADSKKHLVKSDNDDGNGSGGSNASGSNVGGAGSSGKGNKGKHDEETLRKKFPALRR